MQGILSQLFGLSRTASGGLQPSAPNPVAIPIPKGLDPDAARRVSASLFNIDPVEATRQMVGENAELFVFKRTCAEAAGCVTYTRRTTGDIDVREVCRARGGKRFLYAVEPKQGHAGACSACPQGWPMHCRAYHTGWMTSRDAPAYEAFTDGEQSRDHRRGRPGRPTHRSTPFCLAFC